MSSDVGYGWQQGLRKLATGFGVMDLVAGGSGMIDKRRAALGLLDAYLEISTKRSAATREETLIRDRAALSCLRLARVCEVQPKALS